MERSNETNQQLTLRLLQLLYQVTEGDSRGDPQLISALAASGLQVFEVFADGGIRLPASARDTARLLTPGQLLAELHSAAQWVDPFRAALEQASLGQESEVEFRTMDQPERWVLLRIAPMQGCGNTVAIGTIQEVTEAVQERHRQEAAATLLDRMMKSTVAGLEISLEDDAWQMLWGWESYPHLRGGEALSYAAVLTERIAPTLHPRDRDAYLKAMDRSALLGDFFTGLTRRSLDYRVKSAHTPGYDWHSAELDFFRDPATRQVKCNCLIRQVTDYKKKQLEKTRQLQEKEHDLFLRAKKLVESEDELDFVHVIADYYQGIYIVDLETDQARSIKVPLYFADLLARAGNCLSRTMELYARELMAPAFVPDFLRTIDFGNLRRTLTERGQVEMTFQKKDGTWLAMRILPMPGYAETAPKTLWIFEDETDTVNLRQEEEKARVTAQAAEAASQAKSQFLANMSHDIRTPLNAILGMSELGLRAEEAEEKDTCFRDIRGSGRILLENINSILDLSKIEAGKMEITPASYRVHAALRDVIAVLRMRAQEKKLAFTARIDEAIPSTLFGDDVNISHIIMNLGANAVKYTEQGSVTLSVAWEPEGEDGCLSIAVTDTGVGIRQEDLPHIFHSYGRLDRGPNRRIEGTGLGLTICQNLAQLMDGQIGVKSIYGAGSTFWVRLPQKVIDPTPCGPYQEDGGRESDRYYNSFAAPEAVVLVVDDQVINLKVIQGLLRPYEMEVYTARSGREALKQMTQVWPDLVLMDHMMPEMDGVEVTQAIRAMGRKDPYFAVVPILALTANAMKGMREFFLDHGFNDFISKPVALDVLDQALRAWVPEDKQKAPARPGGTPGQRQSLPQDLIGLPGVDVAQGMALGGTEEVYRKTLSIFREQVAGKVRRIRQALQEGKEQDYAIEVHSLKSAARWIGAMELGDRAERLEMAARSGRLDQAAQDTPALLEEYQTLGAALKQVREG